MGNIVIDFQDNLKERRYTAELIKKAISFIKKKHVETDNPVYSPLLQACEKVEEPTYIASGRNSDVYGIDANYVIKRNGTNNYKIPESEFVLQPLLQCEIDGQAIEIYDRMVPPTREEIQSSKYCLLKALHRDGIYIDDRNNGFAMINPKTGMMQVVDNEDCVQIEDPVTARKAYDEEAGKELSIGNFTLPPNPTIEEIRFRLHFPRAIKQQVKNNFSLLKGFSDGR